MNAVDVAISRLKVDEGFRAKPYRDTNRMLTIGYGCNLEAGLTPHAAEALLTAQADELHTALAVYCWYEALDEVRQSVCLEIAFNTGLHGLQSFPRMIDALRQQDWATAAQECSVSDPRLAARYAKLAQLLLIGAT